MNGFGKASNSLKKYLASLVKCEQNLVSDFANIKLVLIFVGVAILSLCSLALIPFTVFIEKSINTLWKKIRTAAAGSAVGLKQICIRRLDEVHDYIYIPSEDEDNRFDKEIKKFSYIKRYLWRIGLFLLVGTVYYLILNYTFMVKFESLLNLKPEMLSLIVSTRALLADSQFWYIQSITGELFHNDMSIQFKQPLPFDLNYFVPMNQSLNELAVCSRSLVQTKYTDLFGSANYDMMLKGVNDSNIMMAYGINPAIYVLTFDILYLTQGKPPFDIVTTVYMPLYYLINSMASTLESIYTSAKSNAVSFIKNQLDLLVLFCSVAFFIFIGLYVVIYFPFLSKEERKIRYMKDLITFIAPREETHS
jgi:hypothetical protein